MGDAVTPCTTPIYAPHARVQMRHGRELGRVTPQRPVFKPGLGWVYRVLLDGTVFPVIVTEQAMRWPEMPEISGNVVALFGAAEPKTMGAA